MPRSMQTSPINDNMYKQPWHSLKNKTIWVTGGAGYLGSAITEELDNTGAHILCFDLPGRAQEFVQSRQLKNTIALDLDVTDKDSLLSKINGLIAEYGVPDGLVHLPTASSSGRQLEELSAGEFQATFDNGLTPPFFLPAPLPNT